MPNQIDEVYETLLNVQGNFWSKWEMFCPSQVLVLGSFNWFAFGFEIVSVQLLDGETTFDLDTTQTLLGVKELNVTEKVGILVHWSASFVISIAAPWGWQACNFGPADC